MKHESYLGNPLLKSANVPVNYSPEQVQEFIKCSQDPIYFIENHIKVVNLDRGLVNLELYPFQKKIVKCINDNRFTICKIPRQSGKSICVVSYLLHYCLFNDNARVAILANKASTAKEILERFKKAYENLPKYLQQGVIEWNKFSIELENGSKIVSAATSSSAIRGGSFHCISGESKIKILDTWSNIEYDISIEDFYNANSSRISKNYKYLYENDEQQIQENIFFTNEKSPKSNSAIRNYGNPSYCSDFFGWKEYQEKLSEIDHSRTYFSPSTTSSFFNRNRKEQNVSCYFSDDTRQAGKILEIITGESDCNNERVFGSKKKYENRKNFIGRNQKKDQFVQHRKEDFTRTKIKTIIGHEGSISWLEEIQRGLSKNINWSSWEEKNERAFGQNKQKSGKNTKNGGEASRNEKIRRSQIKYENCGFESNKTKWRPLEQRNEADRFKISTPDGFKSFKGISKTHNRPTIKIQLTNSFLICTPDHKIYDTNGNKKEAAKYSVGDKIATSDGGQTVCSIENTTDCDVYDILHVEDTNSFYANGIHVSNCIVLDEFAFISENIAEDFFSSVYPTISSGKNTKLIIISTPNGLNHFYKQWTNAVNNKSDYVPIEAHWTDVPGRDENFKRQTIANTSERQWNQEFECQFLGSENTLISHSKLATLSFKEPIYTSTEGLHVFEEPEKDKIYCMTVDTSKGDGQDYHAFTIFDCTSYPLKQVARFKNNTLTYQLYPNYIKKYAETYNNAFVLFELNGLGQPVADILYEDLEYTNIINVSNKGKKGQKADGGFGGQSKSQLGIIMSYQIKRIGCGVLKDLVENGKLILPDFDTISELSTYISKGQGYEAAEGYNDDLATTLVLFSWLTTQSFYKDYTDSDTRKKMFAEKIKQIEEELLPFGFINDGVNPEEEINENNQIFGSDSVILDEKQIKSRYIW